ncbi:hypothetical protein EJB05_10828, partial [Eragrostis curvula]
MAASGFGREAGPSSRGPGSAVPAFGAGAATTSAPSPATSPFPPALSATPIGSSTSPFPSVRPTAPLGASTPSFPSVRPASPFRAAAPRFPSPRPQLTPTAATSRPATTPQSPPIPIPSTRPTSAPGATASARFPSSRPALDPGAAAATGRHVARHLQPQPRPAAPSVSRPVDPFISARSRGPSPLSNPRAGSPTDYNNGMGQRRLLNYSDPLFENGTLQSSEQMMIQPSEFGNRARSPQSNSSSKFRPPSTFQDNHPVQIADPHEHVSKFSGPLQSRPLDHNISKRSRSPTLSYQDVDGAEAHRDAGANARRLVDYTDTFIGGENVEMSKRMRSPSSEFTRTIKSPPSDIRENIRSSAADFGGSNAAHSLRAHADVQNIVAITTDQMHPFPNSEIKHNLALVLHVHHHLRRLVSQTLIPMNVTFLLFLHQSPLIFSATKRTDPPLDARDDVHAVPLTELEREEEVKAKRLARFHVELSRPVENTNDYVKTLKGSAEKIKQVTSVGKVSMLSNDDTDERMADMDSPELAAIVGLCPDMCPEPERAERERKGDLDRYERLGGDRNQTTELLAVKKYNRTAERDADLIRPLPVLQKTMDYLLNLLDHAYDDNFLGLYNFLWDRMRAIRMDLRMQHFFNQDAISMLEQMIRLHIIAMHELCEYNKGEGFSEGFDAHLNIEQMNKTSVELFQMYDDHRRKGVFFPAEKEFRGYYALLKLDKHPGYKVEPAELSLDLAKMSREIKGSPEILFAREVARACRMGNFIAFFRLARKATYLQACLMHAHFAKLRRQALASLHSGLQNGQGIPISHAVEWLAMEDEDIEGLVEYHGFGLRQYEELYLVKEGPFINSESDLPSGRSQLVHSKKSQKIVDDVSSGPVCAPISKKETTILYSGRLGTGKRELFPPQHALAIPADGKGKFDLPFSQPVSPISGRQVTPPNSGSFSPKSVGKQLGSTYSSPLSPTAIVKGNVSFFPTAVSPRTSKLEIFSKTPKVASPKAKSHTKLADDLMADEDQDGRVTGFPQKVEMQAGIPWSQANTKPSDFEEPTASHPHEDSTSFDYSSMNGEEDEFREHGSCTGVDMDEGTPPYHEVLFIKPGSPIDTRLSDDEEYEDHNIGGVTEDDELPIVMSQKKQISNERLRAILRKWSQRAADKRFLREQKNALAVSALSSLSLGPPIHNSTMVPKLAVHELDIGHAFKERHARQQRSWSRLNVSELSGPILLEKNPGARCLCWKLLLLVPPGSLESQTNNVASKWLLRKLMGSGNEDGGLIFSSSGLSIWTEWISTPSTCCLSIVRASDQQVIGDDITDSASCIVFVVSENISWEMQKLRFSGLLASIPAQSNLPLLILSCDAYNEGHDSASQYICDRLGLSDLSGGKISSSSVIFLVENYMEGYGNGFFDDDNMREGLKWLASKLSPQPDVTLVKTHELLLDFLNPQLELLSRHATPEVALGIAFQCSTMLSTSLQKRFWLHIGWSSPSRIQPLLAGINSCKLPDFSYDLSWLNQGSFMGKQTQDQKLFLEECLSGYLTESAQLLNKTQVAIEVNIMVQKCVGLDLRDSYYYLVPRWIAIFRRIYNWRLAKLFTGEFSEAYVLSQHLYQASAAESNVATQYGHTATGNATNESSVLEDHSMMPAVSTGLCLDEVIEISCDLNENDVHPVSPLPPRLPTQVHEEPQAPADSNGEVNEVHGLINGKMCIPRRVDLSEFMPLEKDEKLARLLEQCSNLQDRIDETLSMYF